METIDGVNTSVVDAASIEAAEEKVLKDAVEYYGDVVIELIAIVEGPARMRLYQ